MGKWILSRTAGDFIGLDALTLFRWRVWGAADVHVAQILQRRFLFVAHTPGEIGIVEPLIARRLWHIFQDAELLLDHLLAVPGHLLHTWQNVALDVFALLGSQISPGVFFFAEVGALRRAHAVPLIELLADFGLLIRRKILKGLAVLQDIVALLRTQRAHLVHPGPRRSHPKLLPAR
jgi:hypothetical protein